jgi:predicted outer membrane repeat protein
MLMATQISFFDLKILTRNSKMLTKRFLSFLFSVLVLVATAFPAAVPAHAASFITVDSTSNAAVSDGVCTLSEAIINANNNRASFPDCDPGSGADTIDFAYPITNITVGSQLPQITDPNGLTIDGYNEVSINGNGTDRVFSVAASASLTLNRLTVTGGSCIRCGGGGALNHGTLTITNSTFDSNIGDGGGAIYNDGTLVITGSTFSNNSNDLSVDRSGGRGGAIWNYGGAATITNSHFSHNVAVNSSSSPESYGLGSAIYNGYKIITQYGCFCFPASLTIADSIFDNNNQASNDGGVIFNDAGTMDITNSIFSNNSAGRDGGVVYNADAYYGYPPNTLNLKNSTFSNNSAGRDGGAIHNVNSLTITNSTFSGNHARQSGGSIFTNDGFVTIQGNSTFSGNRAEKSGGAIYNGYDGFGTLLAGKLMIFDHSLLTNNSAGAGGGVANTGRLDILDSTFSGNRADGALSSDPLMGNGGGVLNNLGVVTVENSTFSGNHSIYGNGGGLYNTFYDSTGELSGNMLQIMTSIFTGNGAPGNGGGIFTKNAATISSSAFTSNTAGSGGGIYNDTPTQFTEQSLDPVLTVTNSTFYYNTSSALGSKVGGGGLFNAGHTILTNNTFSGDAAAPQGADIFQGRVGIVPTLSLYNNILAASNAGPNCFFQAGTIASSHNLIQEPNSSNACGFTNGVNGNLVGLNPNLGALTGSPAYFPLNAGSAAIDIGDDAYCPVTDQRGATRPQGVHCDIGAYEAQAPTPTNTPIATATAMPTLTSTPTVVATPTNTSTPLPAPTQCSDIDVACLPPPDGS